MANRALITKSVLNDLKGMDKVDRANLLQAIDDLQACPHPGDEQRVIALDKVFAVTRGKFRIVYQHTSDEFTILGVRETAPQYLGKGYRRVRPQASVLGKAARIVKRIGRVKRNLRQV